MTHLSQSAFAMARKNGGFTLSFEVFPAADAAGNDALVAMARELQCYTPAFMSVTYGAGGSTQNRTLQSVSRLVGETDHSIAGHLTCVGAERRKTDAVVDMYEQLGLRHIVALRGDAPAGSARYQAHPQGYRNARDLVASLARRGGFDISVAAYPEVHPDSPSREADMDNLAAKLDAGADRAITQFFFDNDMFYRLQDRCAARGLSQPIVPGILLIHDFAKVCSFAARCGTSIPEWLHARFAGLEADLEAQKLVAASVAAEQVLDLAARGSRHFHFFTLNRPDLALAMCRCLGILPAERQPEAA